VVSRLNDPILKSTLVIVVYLSIVEETGFADAWKPRAEEPKLLALLTVAADSRHVPWKHRSWTGRCRAARDTGMCVRHARIACSWVSPPHISLSFGGMHRSRRLVFQYLAWVDV
jgi:hypothetical protein